jgi:hypothetical protein
MKKVIYVSIPFLVIVIASLVYANNCTPRARQKKHFEELVAQKNDSLIMSEYLAGFNYAGKVKPLADSIALLRSIRIMEEGDCPQLLECALAVLENTRGADSTAKLVYQKTQFNYSHAHGYFRQGCITKHVMSWNKKINCIEEVISPALSKSLQGLVMEKKSDPLWMSRYISQGEMLELCLNNFFGVEELIVYSGNYLSRDSSRIIFEKFSDETIVDYHLGAGVSKKRMLSIAKKLETNSLDDAYAFLNTSVVDSSYMRDLVIRNIGKLNLHDLLFYYSEKMLTKEVVLEKIKVLSIGQLIMEGRWVDDYLFDEYVKCVIKSAKNSSDCCIVADFIDDWCPNKVSKDFWLRILSVKASSML